MEISKLTPTQTLLRIASPVWAWLSVPEQLESFADNNMRRRRTDEGLYSREAAETVSQL